MKKTLLFMMLAVAYSAFSCWYSKSNYTDYIYSINGQTVHQEQDISGIKQYTMNNNIVVDLPLTVSVKLISNQVVELNADNKTSEVGEILRCSLQYRVLPDGNWVTACNYNVPTGTISIDSSPKEYFGSNNIFPKNLKAGDVIMVRLYATDGMWQSGDLDDMLVEKLTTVSTPFGEKLSLPNMFRYMMNGTDIIGLDLGGAWLPHLAVTVVYSGNERPIL